MATIITCGENTLTMTVTDEVVQITRVKLRLFLTYWYVELCRREIYGKLACEGCEKNWCSQRDHECCKNEYEIFEDRYEGIKNGIPFDVLREVCRQLTISSEIPMTPEWDSFIHGLRNMSAHAACNLWIEMLNAEDEEDTMCNVISNICDAMNNEKQLDRELFFWLLDYLRR